MNPLIAGTIEALRGAGWIVEPADPPRPLPDHVAKRYPQIPPLAVEFVTALERCERGDEACCLFTVADYEQQDPDRIGWDHIERMMTDPGPPIEGITTRPPDPKHALAARRFWSAHLPIFEYWQGDHEYLAIVAERDADDYGAVVHGFAIDFDSPEPLAPSFRAFLEQLRDVALARPTRSLVYEYYLALLVHPHIIEDGATPPWERGPMARLRRWFRRQ